jgi:hypothetical protein
MDLSDLDQRALATLCDRAGASTVVRALARRCIVDGLVDDERAARWDALVHALLYAAAELEALTETTPRSAR